MHFVALLCIIVVIVSREEIALQALWVVGFLVVAGVVIAASVRSVVLSARNDTLPATSAQARISRISGRNSNMLTGLLTGKNSYFQNVYGEYYVTFELLPERGYIKFTIPIVEYPEINEGDTGTLIFQGTRFISFEQQLDS